MAAEAKTRPTDASVDDFIASVPDARRRRDAAAMQTLMSEVSGLPPVLWGTSIVGFGSYRAATGDWPRLAFAPRGSALVLYVSLPEGARAPWLARLAPATGKGGCIYVKDLAKIDPAAVRDLCVQGWREMEARHPSA